MNAGKETITQLADALNAAFRLRFSLFCSRCKCEDRVSHKFGHSGTDPATRIECALAAHLEEMPTSPALIAELDRRMESNRKDSTQITTWEAAKTHLLGSAAPSAF